MRVLFLVTLTFVLFTSLCSGQVCDQKNGMTPPATTGSRGAGDVLHTITGPASPGKGVAHDGTNLLVIADLIQLIHILDDTTGLVLGTVPINSNDFGLAYDTKRQLYVTTSVITDEVKLYDGISSNPIKTFPSPHAGPNGAAYDLTRDVYWISDFKDESVSSVDPVTGATLITFPLSPLGCTRTMGCAYDPANDEIYVGGRDQSMIFVLNAVNGTLKDSFPAQGAGSNNPGGLACTPRQTLWQTRGDSADIHELDMGHGPGWALWANPDTLSAATGGQVDFKLIAGQEYAYFTYLVIGGISGTSPGIPIKGGLILPVNWDVFTNLEMNLLNSTIFVNFLSYLDGLGNSQATFNTLGPLPPSTVGLVFYFAYPVIGNSSMPWSVSNAVTVTVGP